MLPDKLKELWDGMTEVRERTLELIGALSDSEFCRREGEEWSAADVLEHLLIAETGASKVIRKCLKEQADSLPPYPADDSGLAVRPMAVSPERMTVAPEMAVPKGGAGKEELLRRAKECREQTRLSLGMLAGADPRGAEFPHPVFGRLNLYEWPAILVLGHERQHHAQLEGILRRARR